MTNLDGLSLYTALTRLFSTLPRLDRPQALALAELAAARGAAETFDLLVTLIDVFLARLARFGTTGTAPPEAAKGEAQFLARLAPHPMPQGAGPTLPKRFPPGPAGARR
jgi:DNA polymerase III subunit delta'